MLHLYRVFNCKTPAPGCGKRYDRADLGPTGTGTRNSYNDFIDPFEFTCPECGATYSYTEADTRLVTEDPAYRACE